MALSRVWKLGAALAAAAVSACDSGPATVVDYHRGTGLDSFLAHASKDGPMLVEIHGQPWPDAAQETEGLILETMADAVKWRVVRFTTRADEAPAPNFKVVLVFDPAAQVTGRHLCAGKIPESAGGGDKTRLTGVFCADGELWTEVRGWIKPVLAPTDEKFRKLIWYVTHDALREQ